MITTQPYLLTVLGETKLFAQHSCVSSSPEVVAHITPHSIVAHLNTALVDMWTINQLRVSISTACERNNVELCNMKNLCVCKCSFQCGNLHKTYSPLSMYI